VSQREPVQFITDLLKYLSLGCCVTRTTYSFSSSLLNTSTCGSSQLTHHLKTLRYNSCKIETLDAESTHSGSTLGCCLNTACYSVILFF